MATKRFGYLDDFTLKNSKVGIGTSTANEKLEVIGGTRGGGVVVTGIATLTSYSGFQNKNTSYVENVDIPDCSKLITPIDPSTSNFSDGVDEFIPTLLSFKVKSSE